MDLRDHASDMANELAGNHLKISNFGWRNRPEPGTDWALIYTHNRDSGLLEQSNAAVYHRTLKPFSEGTDPDVRFESHGHWAVGHVDGFAIRVYRGGELTPAWLAFCELKLAESDCPVLDEGDFSQRKYDAAIEAIDEVLRGIEGDGFGSVEAGDIFSWLWKHEQSELEDTGDGQGAYPSRESVERALEALGFSLESDDE